MVCSGWGRYPKVECERIGLRGEEFLRKSLHKWKSLIPYGNGRSYGDSALNPAVIHTRPYDCFLGFDEREGVLHVQSGVLLSEILEAFVPRGWFLAVTPGTKFITVGGAIASDVHGKNHHRDGCFSEWVKEFRIMLADGRVVTCSKDEPSDLWRATCGGMGLTGVILDAKLILKRINSIYLKETIVKTRNLQETFEAFEEYRKVPYSVAWIDCLAKCRDMGRSLVMVGDFMEDGELDYSPRRKMGVPCGFPGFILNKWSIQAFNHLYYGRVRDHVCRRRVDIDSFFYPLDSIQNWNRVYGSRGFVQYQFILPKHNSYQGLEEVLWTISKAGKGSFLAVLKLYGETNGNWLSFPMEGYSLALDFKVERGIFDLLDRLDNIVLKYGGRIYLTKDARVSRGVFEKGYPEIDKFRKFRRENGMDSKFLSLQSKRVGI